MGHNCVRGAQCYFLEQVSQNVMSLHFWGLAIDKYSVNMSCNLDTVYVLVL